MTGNNRGSQPNTNPKPNGNATLANSHVGNKHNANAAVNIAANNGENDWIDWLLMTSY